MNARTESLPPPITALISAETRRWLTSNIPIEWIGDFGKGKPRTVMFTLGDDAEEKRVVMDLLSGAGFAPIDLGSLRDGVALHEVGAPLSGLGLHLKRRLR